MSIKIDMEIMFNGTDNQANFTTQLLHLIFKADQFNKGKLRLGFPHAVETVEYYQQTGEILDLSQD
ncbi:hypothetical protein LCGC14_1202820 [marine sediment metagenome]|uniref:Uncharacterized protein n=1 Tax=marine sediment metagenome TaxID=412755 RepID=A0A0F9LGF2_9ZZZZ